MRLITILNRCTKFKRFVFEGSHLDEHERIMVNVRSRKNSKAECSRWAFGVWWQCPFSRQSRPTVGSRRTSSNGNPE